MSVHAAHVYSNPDRVWYFAYGANLTAESFRTHRGIQPFEAVPVSVPGWCLTFDIYGIPYKEPAFASISPWSDPIVAEDAPQVHGTAYLVDQAEYYSIIASEGGGTAYDEVVVVANPIGPQSSDQVAPEPFTVMALTRAYCPTMPRCPSQRYKGIIMDGAREANLPSEYRAFLEALPVYEPARTAWQLIGAAIFLAIWVPFMALAERLTVATTGWDGRGNCPKWVLRVVRFILWLMWLHHDRLHARLFGRGDGLHQATILESGVLEKQGAIYLA